MARPFQGGEKTTAVWASHHEELCGDGVVAPPVCAHMVVPCRWVVLDGCNPSWSAVDAGLDAAAWTRRAERTAAGGVWTFHEPSLGRHVLHELMRNAVLNLTLIIPANTYKRRSYYERYSRSTMQQGNNFCLASLRLRQVPLLARGSPMCIHAPETAPIIWDRYAYEPEEHPPHRPRSV